MSICCCEPGEVGIKCNSPLIMMEKGHKGLQWIQKITSTLQRNHKMGHWGPVCFMGKWTFTTPISLQPISAYCSKKILFSFNFNLLQPMLVKKIFTKFFWKIFWANFFSKNIFFRNFFFQQFFWQIFFPFFWKKISKKNIFRQKRFENKNIFRKKFSPLQTISTHFNLFYQNKTYFNLLWLTSTHFTHLPPPIYYWNKQALNVVI